MKEKAKAKKQLGAELQNVKRGAARPGENTAERQLAEKNTRRLATVVRDSNDAITIQDFEGRITAWNRGAELMYGYSEAEALQMNIGHLTPPDKEAEQKDFLRRIFAGEKVTSFETQRLTKDGRLLDVWMVVTKLVDAADKVIGIASTERDITGRKRKEEEASRMVTVVRDSNDAIAIQDFEGRITAWNRGAELMYGYSEAEALQMNIGRLTPPDKEAEQKDFLRRIFAGEKVTSFETQRLTKDGRLLDVWMVVTKLVDAADKVIGIASTERDITTRKRAEEAARASEAEKAARASEAEEAARASEAEKALILDNVGDIIAYHDKNMRLVWANQAYLNGIGSITGTPARMEEVRGLHCCEAWKLTKPCIGCPVSVALRTGETNEAELSPENQPHWPATQGAWSIKASPLHDAQGNVIGAIEVSRNITERKKADALLHIKGTAVASAIAGIAISDLDGRISYVNAAWLHMHGHDSDAEVMGTTPSQHVRNPADVEAIVKAIKQEGHWTGELVCRRRDGSHFAAELATNLMMDSTGRPMGMLASFQDITERVRAEEDLRVASLYSRNLLETSLDPLVTISAEGRITDINTATEKITGMSRERLIGSDFSDYFTEPEMARAGYQKVFEQGQVIDYPLAVRHTSGAIIEVLYNASVYRNEQGKVLGVFAAARDITERKRVEEERERLLQSLEEKTKELEQVLYAASHDLRSPLVNIQGFAKELEQSLKQVRSLLQSKDISPEVREKLIVPLDEDIPEALQYILTSAYKIDSLLGGLLQLSRLGRAELDIKRLNMNKLMESVIHTFEFSIKERGVKLEVGDLPPCRGDETRINQLFSNLIDNALKFLDPDRPGIIKVEGEKRGEQAVYCVEDNGIGIAPEYHERVFEIFERLNPTTGTGEGLGLTIVRGIADRHNGKIWLESEPGKGSRFFVSLPAA